MAVVEDLCVHMGIMRHATGTSTTSRAANLADAHTGSVILTQEIQEVVPELP